MEYKRHLSLDIPSMFYYIFFISGAKSKNNFVAF